MAHRKPQEKTAGKKTAGKPAGKVRTNTQRDSVAQVPYKRKVRLLLWGGAYNVSDNNTFERAALTVIRDYKKSDQNRYEIVKIRIDTASDFISIINNQEIDSIRSLDIFTHGGPDNMYMVTVRSNKDGLLNNFKWYRYVFHDASFDRSDIEKLKLDRFTDDAKIEFHGCKTAKSPTDEDNIVSDISKALFGATKMHSSAIGHIDSSGPEIDGKGRTADVDQDYRWGDRAIYKNGRLVNQTTQKGMIDESELAK